MKKTIFLCICIALVGLSQISFAQKRVSTLDYEKYSEEVRKETWGWNRPEFNNRSIPSEYAKTSIVIMAEHHEIGLNAVRRFNAWGLLSMNASDLTNQELYYANTIRKMVKLNDKSAIEKYSEISFQEYFATYGFRSKAASMTVVGVRIIKPDGSIKEVDVNDQKQLEGTKKDRSRKLAIADLQVGDIIDYFIHYTEQMDYKNIDPMDFVLAGSDPVLSFSIHLVTDKNLTTEHRSINGAPDFTVSKNKDGNFDLSMKKENIAPLANEQWISVGRQVPTTTVSIFYNSSVNLFHPESARDEGVHKDVSYKEIISDYKWYVFFYGMYYKPSADKYYKPIKKLVKSYKKAHPKPPTDSIACLIYHAMQHYYLNDWEADEVMVDYSRNSYSVGHLRFLACFTKMLQEFDIKSNLVFAPSVFGPTMNNIANVNDLNAFVSTQSNNPILFATPSAFTEINRIPAGYEGQEAIVFNINKYKKGDFKKNDKDKKITLPVSTAAQNKRYDEMQVKMDMSNPLELQFDRTTSVSGHLKEYSQRMLLLYENYEALNRKALAVEKSMREEMSDKRKTRALIQEYDAAFAEAREKQKEFFDQEVEKTYDAKAKKVSEYSILSAGMPLYKTDLVYNVKYIMDGFVRKAGNNYTLDIGKLVGTQLHLEAKERVRSMDIYRAYGRTFANTLTFTIPDGYTVEGLDAVQYNLSNPCGKFIVKATMNGNTLQLEVVKEYSHGFEPVANWANLLQVIDGANEFYGKSVMLRKAK